MSDEVAALIARLDALPKNLRAELRPNLPHLKRKPQRWRNILRYLFGHRHRPSHIDAPPNLPLKPYYDPAACWGCGLNTPETEAFKTAMFRHPVFRLPILCRYCEELHELTRTP